MLVKISPKYREPNEIEEYGAVWINTDAIALIVERIHWREVGRESGRERTVWYDVVLGDYTEQLSKEQFEELLIAMPTPTDGAQNLALYRKYKQESLAEAERWREERRL